MRVHARVNSSGWRNTASELRMWKKMDVPAFVKHRGRVLSSDLGKWTPPRGKNPGSEGWPSMKKRGEKTLEADIRKVFLAVDKLSIYRATTKYAKALRKYVSQGNTQAVKKLLENIGIKCDSVFPIPYGSIHESARTRRGRVGGSKQQHNWVFHDSSIKQYIAQRKREVGKAKSHWWRAGSELGASFPVWVTRHGRNGQLIDNTKFPDRPTLVLINDAPAARDFSQAEIVDAAIAVNERKMIKELQAIVAHQTRRHSFR